MSRSEKKRARRLRWRLMQSLTVTFVLLWLGTMVLFTSNTCSDMESGAKTAARAAQTSVDEHYEFYTNNIASGLGEQANHILSGNLSSLSLGQVSEMDGGMAFVVRTLYGYERSQLSWGWGNQEGTDLGQRWYFSFDEGLDDQGQIALANWIIANRDGWDYTIYPDEYRNSNTGSFARVTGVERPGYEIAVQKIEIIHPDGTTQTMVETSTEGESKTWDFAYLSSHPGVVTERTVRSIWSGGWLPTARLMPFWTERSLVKSVPCSRRMDLPSALRIRMVW